MAKLYTQRGDLSLDFSRGRMMVELAWPG